MCRTEIGQPPGTGTWNFDRRQPEAEKLKILIMRQNLIIKVQRVQELLNKNKQDSLT